MAQLCRLCKLTYGFVFLHVFNYTMHGFATSLSSYRFLLCPMSDPEEVFPRNYVMKLWKLSVIGHFLQFSIK